MVFRLGIDLGTTFTAAAVDRAGHLEMASLGDRSTAIPSVVLVRSDGTVLVGDAAHRRAATEPDGVTREFKRRLGDPTPLVLAGQPHSVPSVLARLLEAVVGQVSEREGGAPDGVVLTHPANWGPYKRELFDSVPRLAGVEQVSMVSEPEAAAVHYASNERVERGSTVAVYDLGGGTFDATVLRKQEAGFEILGDPEGIEGLGGVDFDEAVFAHVNHALDGRVAELDPTDPGAAAALVRLRQECVLAKEALSADTETTIPVLLPDATTEVRLTRSEFEEMIRPSLSSTVASLRRALTSARVTPDDLSTVLLVGGSSRIPLVSQLLSSELGRPTAVDAHPKHAIALGAAAVAGMRRRPQGGRPGGGRGTRPGPAAGLAGAAAGASASPQRRPPTPPRGTPMPTPSGGVPVQTGRGMPVSTPHRGTPVPATTGGTPAAATSSLASPAHPDAPTGLVGPRGGRPSGGRESGGPSSGLIPVTRGGPATSGRGMPASTPPGSDHPLTFGVGAPPPSLSKRGGPADRAGETSPTGAPGTSGSATTTPRLGKRRIAIVAAALFVLAAAAAGLVGLNLRSSATPLPAPAPAVQPAPLPVGNPSVETPAPAAPDPGSAGSGSGAGGSGASGRSSGGSGGGGGGHRTTTTTPPSHCTDHCTGTDGTGSSDGTGTGTGTGTGGGGDGGGGGAGGTAGTAGTG